MKSKRIALIIANIGVILILLGLGIQMIQYQKKITELKELADIQATQIIECNEEENRLYGAYLELEEKIMTLEAENKSLWDNYYTNVTNQEGYEYHE